MPTGVTCVLVVRRGGRLGTHRAEERARVLCCGECVVLYGEGFWWEICMGEEEVVGRGGTGRRQPFYYGGGRRAWARVIVCVRREWVQRRWCVVRAVWCSGAVCGASVQWALSQCVCVGGHPDLVRERVKTQSTVPATRLPKVQCTVYNAVKCCLGVPSSAGYLQRLEGHARQGAGANNERTCCSL